MFGHENFDVYKFAAEPHQLGRIEAKDEAQAIDIAAKRVWVGTVEAKDEAEAIAKASRKFLVAPNWLIAQPPTCTLRVLGKNSEIRFL
jgi:hypothetical protein